jgi:hypothetical protein
VTVPSETPRLDRLAIRSELELEGPAEALEHRRDPEERCLDVVLTLQDVEQGPFVIDPNRQTRHRGHDPSGVLTLACPERAGNGVQAQSDEVGPSEPDLARHLPQRRLDLELVVQVDHPRHRDHRSIDRRRGRVRQGRRNHEERPDHDGCSNEAKCLIPPRHTSSGCRSGSAVDVPQRSRDAFRTSALVGLIVVLEKRVQEAVVSIALGIAARASIDSSVVIHIR